MDLIWTDVHGKEMGYVLNVNSDFEIGAEEKDSINDFEIEFKRKFWTGDINYGCRIISPSTEYGGIISEIATNTKADNITVKGYTWRGMMTKKVIQPFKDQDYALASGEINSIIKTKVETEFPGLFYGSDKDTGIRVTNFQFDRYCTLHEGLAKMLKSVGHRLDIRYQEGEVGESGYVKVQAVPIIDYSSEYELSNDNGMNFITNDNKRGVNHLICLGKGELKNRLVIHMYVDREGNIGTVPYYKGIDEITEIYDSSGAEKSDLLKNGKEKLETLKNKMSYNMTMEKLEGNLDLGDIIGGRDYLTGIYVKKPISRKIWTISEGKEKIEYKLEGET